ncbi:MAG: hypothetical protein MJY96_07780 [Bacteroidaceae bacterium]|nr:hypothetical protein [Bacteroidaceae bacterium]
MKPNTTIGNKTARHMKKSALILMSMAAMFGLSSCDKELVPAENTNNRFTIHATTESGTKTALSWNDENKNYDVVWSEGDQFAIYNNSVGNTYTKVLFSSEFTLESGEGTPNGTFTGSAQLNTGIEYMALYPASIYSKSYNKTEWPATTQTYTADKITNSPMFATFTVNEKDQIPTVSFKNMGGIIRLTVKGTATVKSIEVNATELATPITLTCGDGAKLTSEGTVFHIAMPEKTYTGVVITLTDTNDKTCTKTFKGTAGLEIERSMITKASFTASGFNYNVGDKVEFDGHDGIVVDIDGTLVAVATMNVGAESVIGSKCLGTKMTYYAAYEAWSGWRLPTVKELTAFCDPGYRGACGNTEGVEGGTGAMMWDIDGDEEIDLYLPLSELDEDEGRYPCDKYWTEPADNDGKYFYFVPEIDWEGDGGNTYYPIACKGRAYKEETAPTEPYLVRLFHDLP